MLTRNLVSTITEAVKSNVLPETNKQQPAESPQACGTISAEWKLSEEKVQQIDMFVDLLLDWNQRMNLTAVTERDAVMDRHIGDSLALLPVIERALSEHAINQGRLTSAKPQPLSSSTESTLLPNVGPLLLNVDPLEASSLEFTKGFSLANGRTKQPVKQKQQLKADSEKGAEEAPAGVAGGVNRLRVVDVGTGAGLPGLVFAIVRPEWDLILVESLRKRCNFLEHVVKEAGLKNVTVVWGRAEDTARLPNMRASADVAVARAVADLRVLAELCIPYVRKGGLFVAAKGPNPEEEVAAAAGAIGVLGGKLLGVERVASTGPGGQRTAVVCLKEKATPAKYPRRAGVPTKSPL
ncbi:hypothetical protein KFL_003000050 [Klebsormidium nitens]|uniref:Uncharacterized protein n=1 Tax=Klebsormidium nitens TaxID=105231 RepID=A0A1Y1I9H4_KLENI|nr:hypothetical protein KFL_003000050 [Klebsormidium nitens]|eukprot:GAQ86612.1 hypothetical protein KFL_003000050 [Klebsormidium nitens]